MRAGSRGDSDSGSGWAHQSSSQPSGGHEWGKSPRPGGQKNLSHSEVEVSDPPQSQMGGNRVKRREKKLLKDLLAPHGSEPFTAEGPGSADPYQTQPSAG